MTSTPSTSSEPAAEQSRLPLFRRITRPLVAGLLTVSILGTAVACGSSEDTTSSSSSASSSAAAAVTAASDGSNTAEVVAAAEAFMATLTDDQLETLQYDYSDDQAKTAGRTSPRVRSSATASRWAT